VVERLLAAWRLRTATASAAAAIRQPCPLDRQENVAVESGRAHTVRSVGQGARWWWGGSEKGGGEGRHRTFVTRTPRRVITRREVRRTRGTGEDGAPQQQHVFSVLRCPWSLRVPVFDDAETRVTSQ